ncbi:MAG: hypothetical protein ABSE00_02150 [Chitinispirillaceae bacterium]|jgi:hypothetical protein
MHRSFRWISCLFLIGAVATVRAQDYPFTDNFTNPAQTSLRWSQIFPDSFTRYFANGAYLLINQHRNPAIAGLVYHSFTTRVPTFTASCVVKRPADSVIAGMWVCLTVPLAGGAVTGYSFEVGRGGLFTAHKNKTTGASLIFSARYRPEGLTDTIMASKQGNAFSVFCNGVFLGSFSDSLSPMPSGDLGLFIQGNASAMFGDVAFSDRFTPGNFTACMTDSFRGSAIDKRWMLEPARYFDRRDGVLGITAPASTGAFGDVRMALDAFATRLVVSWRSGDSTPLYGSYLFGPADSQGRTPMAQFGICGMKAGRAFLSAADSAIQLKYSPFMKGKAFWQPGYDTVYFKDTVDVRKPAASDYYLMYVNGVVFDSLPVSRVHFPIIGAGMFCWGKQSIDVVYFHAGPTLAECPRSAAAAPIRTKKRK